jgi:hypothetical protein
MALVALPLLLLLLLVLPRLHGLPLQVLLVRPALLLLLLVLPLMPRRQERLPLQMLPLQEHTPPPPRGG